jgi:hypothetical protein
VNMSIITEHNYYCRTTSWSSNGLNNAKTKNLGSSPLRSPYVSNSFINSLSPVDPSKNAKGTLTLHKVTKIRICNQEDIFTFQSIFSI